MRAADHAAQPEIAKLWPGAPVTVTHDLREALEGVDAVQMLRLQLERQQRFLFPSTREYSKLYALTSEKLAYAKPGALVMHPGPMNRGLEISSGVADGDHSAIREQVSNGVAVRMAVLYLLAGLKSRSGDRMKILIKNARLIDPARPTSTRWTSPDRGRSGKVAAVGIQQPKRFRRFARRHRNR